MADQDAFLVRADLFCMLSPAEPRRPFGAKILPADIKYGIPKESSLAIIMEHIGLNFWSGGQPGTTGLHGAPH